MRTTLSNCCCWTVFADKISILLPFKSSFYLLQQIGPNCPQVLKNSQNELDVETARLGVWWVVARSEFYRPGLPTGETLPLLFPLFDAFLAGILPPCWIPNKSVGPISQTLLGSSKYKNTIQHTGNLLLTRLAVLCVFSYTNQLLNTMLLVICVKAYLKGTTLIDGSQ